MALPSATAERHRQIVAAHQRARLHQAAEPEPFARRDLLLGRHRRRREEHDGIAHGVQHQRGSDREHRERTADHRQTPLLARHTVIYPIQPEILEAFVQLLQPLGVVGECLTGIGERAHRLVALAHHHIGANQPEPSFDVVAVLLQPRREPVDHATDHGAAVGLGHVLGRRHRLVRQRRHGQAADPRQRRLHQRAPRRISRRFCQHRLPDRSGCRPCGRPVRRRARGNSLP